MKRKKILIVEDDSSMRRTLAESLAGRGYTVATADNGACALERLQRDAVGMVITDMKMPVMGGMELLRKIKEQSSLTPVPVIVITGYGTVDEAVEAMKEGAADFVMKPLSMDHLASIVAKVGARNGGTEQESTPGRGQPVTRGKKIVTEDRNMRAFLRSLKRLARSKASILIEGESGTGKELMASYIHRHSDRAAMPFVAVNCAAIPHNLLESEMFGYEKGAFTGASARKQGKFELADGGTLMLDEISEMDIALQAKLLRVIQESEVDRVGGKTPVSVDVRIISTTNVDLKRRVRDKKFRGDLYYRLNVIPLRVPPLRERSGDIPVLCEHFLDRYSRLNGTPRPSLSQDTTTLLMRYHWPGNVRELENVIERAVLLSDGETVCPEDLRLDGDGETARPCPASGGETPQEGTLKEMERNLIVSTLKREQGNKTRASEALGISVRTIRNKLNEYKRDEGYAV